MNIGNQNVKSIRIPIGFKTGIPLYPVIKTMTKTLIEEGVFGGPGVPISSLTSAVSASTINNTIFTQTWNWQLDSGGYGIVINNARTPNASTADEAVLRINISGANAARNVTGIKIVNGIANAGKNATLSSIDIEGPGIRLTNGGLTIINSAVSVTPATTALVAGTFMGNVSVTSSVSGGGAAGLRLTQTLASNSTIGFRVTGNGAADGRTVVIDGVGYTHFYTTITTTAGCIVVGASSATRPSLHIESGVAPTIPANGAMWLASNHLYVRLGGVTVQLDNPGGSGGIYTANGNLTGNRIVDMDSFSLTFNECALFRINDPTGVGRYDFNDGVDFLVSNVTQSYSIRKNVITGLILEAVDITNTVTKQILLDITGITFDSNRIKWLNGPVFADDAAAGAGGLAANNFYKTATGEIRIKT